MVKAITCPECEKITPATMKRCQWCDEEISESYKEYGSESIEDW